MMLRVLKIFNVVINTKQKKYLLHLKKKYILLVRKSFEWSYSNVLRYI